MLKYLNTHVAIDQLRHKAQLNKAQGPKVCILYMHCEWVSKGANCVGIMKALLIMVLH